MARPLSGKKTQQDENALRQQEEVKKYHFWIKEFLARRFYKDNKDNFEEFYIAQETLYFAMYYFLTSQQKIPFNVFLNAALNRCDNSDDEIKYRITLDVMTQQVNDNFDIEVRSIMDTILNLTEENPINQVKFFTECSQFYIDNIKE